MAHKHFCIQCGDLIGEGDFDCEIDADHDFALCDKCANEKTARERVATDEQLKIYGNIIMADWSNWAEHMAWVATAATTEIVSWADGIKQNMEESDDDYNSEVA